MTRALHAGLCVLVLASCDRCAPSPGARDSGTARPATAEPAVVDLRWALLTLVPEPRFLAEFGGEAVLERMLSGAARGDGSLLARTRSELERGSFAPVDAGLDWLTATRPPFHLHVQRAGEQLRLQLRLQLGIEDVLKLLQSPAPLTTAEMGVMLFGAPSAVESERFTLSVRYASPPEHAAALLGQVIGGWMKAGFSHDARASTWSPAFNDRGTLEVPERFHVAYRAPSGAEVWAEREGGRVRLSLSQNLRGNAP